MEQLNILMTGGARGIGAGIMEKLTQAGHNLAFCGRKTAAEYAEQTAASASELGLKILCRDSPPHRPVRAIPSCLRSGTRIPNNFSISYSLSSGKSQPCISRGACLLLHHLQIWNCDRYTVVPNNGRSSAKYTIPPFRK